MTNSIERGEPPELEEAELDGDRRDHPAPPRRRGQPVARVLEPRMNFELLGAHRTHGAKGVSERALLEAGRLAQVGEPHRFPAVAAQKGSNALDGHLAAGVGPPEGRRREDRISRAELIEHNRAHVGKGRA